VPFVYCNIHGEEEKIAKKCLENNGSLDSLRSCITQNI